MKASLILTSVCVLASLVLTSSDSMAASYRIRAITGPPNELVTVFSIANDGTVSGMFGSTLGERGFLWRDGTITDLGYSNVVTAINDKSQMVGFIRNGSDYNDLAAVVWENGAPREIGPVVFGGSWAHSINNNGQVIGTAGNHAFLWDNTMTAPKDLGVLGGYESHAIAINDRGQVVGSTRGMDGFHAFIWEDGVIKDLNTLIPANTGWWLEDAQGLNEAGTIVGIGTLAGARMNFILEPVPEPSSILALISGFAGFAFCFKKRTS